MYNSISDMKQRPTIQRLIEFQQLMLQFRAIERIIYIPPDNEARENDIEHSYTLAMSAWFLAPHFPELDRDTVIRLALAHDLIEIHAGDIFAYADKSLLAGKKELEAKAIRRLEREWPDFPELIADIKEYEARSSEEAKFVYALDKVMPAIMNYLSDGAVWHKHDIDIGTFRREKESKISPASKIYPYYRELLALLEEDLTRFFPATDKKKVS